MSGTFQQATICGRLGQDPELKYTQSGSPVTNLSVATDEGYTDNAGNKVEHTEWHKVNVWGRTAENCCQYLSKGRMVLVVGKLRTRKWQDKQGNDRYTTEIQAQRVVFLPSGGGESSGQSYTSPPAASQGQSTQGADGVGPLFPSEASSMDDVPF